MIHQDFWGLGGQPIPGVDQWMGYTFFRVRVFLGSDRTWWFGMMKTLCHQWRSRVACQVPIRHLELEPNRGRRLMGIAGQLQRPAGTRPGRTGVEVCTGWNNLDRSPPWTLQYQPPTSDLQRSEFPVGMPWNSTLSQGP